MKDNDKSYELIEIVDNKTNLSETVFAEVTLSEVRKNRTNLIEIASDKKKQPSTLLG